SPNADQGWIVHAPPLANGWQASGLERRTASRQQSRQKTVRHFNRTTEIVDQRTDGSIAR
ncbi:MAG: hypothetical protein L0387_19120, partial [Acidobacteria bacterium]|nr:hypothetical protein [Acidobacteriota bacterium]